MTLAIGQVLENRYRIKKLLGQGGFGAVYLAEDQRLGVEVAVKESFDTSPDAQRQFYTEATLLARLSHPHLPRVTDHFIEADGEQYLVMDYIAGSDLGQMIERNGPLPVNKAVQWAIQVLNALDYLHRQTPPIIHRDIKPANIRITPEDKAILVDFGISKAADPSMKTTAGARAVSPGFSPLEQYGQARTEARSDLYALGATMYFALTGQAPPDAIELVSGHATLIPPSRRNPGILPHVEQVILRALQSSMENRFASAAEMRRALTTPSDPLRNQPISSPVFKAASQPQPQPILYPQMAAPPLAQPMVQHPIHPIAAALPTDVELAGFGTRLAAFLLDGVITGLISLLACLPVILVGALLVDALSWELINLAELLLCGGISLAVSAFYHIRAYVTGGQTWAKKWLHIRVVDARGRRIGGWRAFWRWVGLFLLPNLVGQFTLGLGYLIYLVPLFDRQRRALHDMFGGTLVVCEPGAASANKRRQATVLVWSVIVGAAILMALCGGLILLALISEGAL